jgi:hypothetical protein
MRRPRLPVRVVADVKLTPFETVAMACEILREYVRVRLLLRRHALPSVVAELRKTPRCATAEHIEPGSLLANHIGYRLGIFVWKTLRVLPTDSRCLMQSLVLTAVMSRRGLDGRLIIGVGGGDRFEAHAWVEHRGVALLPDDQLADRRLLEV